MFFNRLCFVLAMCVLVACGSPAPTTESTPATTTEVTQPPTQTAATSIWKDKLNGAWEQEGEATTIEWIIDLDGKTLSTDSFGKLDSVPIAFEREEGKTVYVTIQGRVGDRLDAFRFVSDDLVQWTQGDKTTPTTLKRSK